MLSFHRNDNTSSSILLGFTSNRLPHMSRVFLYVVKISFLGVLLTSVHERPKMAFRFILREAIIAHDNACIAIANPNKFPRNYNYHHRRGVARKVCTPKPRTPPCRYWPVLSSHTDHGEFLKSSFIG